MTNNIEDFDQPDFPHEEPQQKRGFGSNLASAWRSQPLFKLFVLMVVVAAIVAVSVSFFSGNGSRSVANFVKPPDLNEAPGGKASPYMKQQTELANSQRTQDALKNGGSALPTPIGQTSEVGEIGASSAKDEQLTELRAEVQSMNRQLQQAKQAPPPQPQVQQQQQPQQFDETLAQAMQKQMTQLTDSWTPKGIVRVPVTKVTEENNADHAGSGGAAANAAGSPDAASTSSLHKVIVPAGTVSYAQLLTEANSDVPGPILAQIVSGPLAGARAVGQFQVANGAADYLVLQFNVANLKGRDYALSAIALDPDTTLGGMATEVNQRYFTRVVLPAAAGFLQGFGSALGQGSSSIVSNGNTTIVQQSGKGVQQGAFTGLGQAAQSASQFFQNQANLTRPLVRVAAGTPIGMFFVASVLEPQNAPGTATVTSGTNGYYPVNMQGYGGQQGGYGNAPGYGNGGGYPGAGYGGNPQQIGGAGYNPAANVPYPNYGGQNINGAPNGYTNNLGIQNGYPGATTIYTNR